MLGIDFNQWRVLHTVMFKNNLRRASGITQKRSKKPTKRKKKTGSNLSAFFGFGVIGLVLPMMVSQITVPLLGEFMVLTSMMVMVFIGFMVEAPDTILSAKDYEILGPLPINSNTYMATKISAALAGNALMCAIMSTPILVLFVVTEGLLVAAGWMLAVSLFVVFSGFAVIGIYLALVNSVAPNSVRSITMAVQMLGVLVICLSFVLFTSEAIEQSAIANLDLTNNAAFLLFPPYWFTSILGLVRGEMSVSLAVGSILALFGALPFVWYLTTKGSDSFFKNLSQTISASTSDSNKTNEKHDLLERVDRWFGIEVAMVWKMLFTHMKYDPTTRSVFSSIPPLLVIYLAIPLFQGTISDPFLDIEAVNDMMTINISVLLMPVMMIDQSRFSGQYAGGWLLFAAPIDLAKYSRSLSDFVAMTLLLPYSAILIAIFCFFFESPLHAFMYVATLGWLSFAMLQVKAWINPILPFTEPFSSTKFMIRFFVTMITIAIVAGVGVKLLAQWVFPDTLSYCVSLVFGIILCIWLRWLAYRRNSVKFRRFEFSG